MTTPETKLSVRALWHRFGPTEVLSDIDLELRPGESVALVGPSGCGKTTLLNLCAGLLRPTGGKIVNGFERSATVFQQPRLLPWKNTIDNIALGLKALGTAGAERMHRARALALQMGLAHTDMEKFPHQLSGGMQARVALARAFAIEPDLLLLDEPFSALDLGLKAELHALLLQYTAARARAVLMVTHDLMEAVALSQRIVLMAAADHAPGRIVCQFVLKLPPARRDDAWVYRNTATLLEAPQVRSAFGLKTLGACRTLGVDSEKRPQRGQFLPNLQTNSPAIGQKDGEKWTAAVDLQPTSPKSDRLLEQPSFTDPVHCASHDEPIATLRQPAVGRSTPGRA